LNESTLKPWNLIQSNTNYWKIKINKRKKNH
jgi:hypothetical protein